MWLDRVVFGCRMLWWSQAVAVTEGPAMCRKGCGWTSSGRLQLRKHYVACGLLECCVDLLGCDGVPTGPEWMGVVEKLGVDGTLLAEDVVDPMGK